MASVSPKLKAVIVASGTIRGELSMRAIKNAKQTPIQLVLRDAGFVPGDVVEITLLEDYEALKKEIEELRAEVEALEYELIIAHDELNK